MCAAIAKILIVEDDPQIGKVLTMLLREVCYEVEVAEDGLEGYKLALAGGFDLVLLDVALPSMNGLDICRQLKNKLPHLPIIMLTAQGEESDIVSGLEVGSDDYIPKPFRPREVLARIRARLRQVSQSSDSAKKVDTRDEAAPIVIGEIRIEPDKMIAYKRGEVLALSAREFEVLLLLAENPGQPFSRETLLADIWQFDSEDYNVNVSVFFSRLRRKIEDDPENPRYILTIRGIGYRFVEPSQFSAS